MLSHGGHAAAAGLKIDPSQIDAFREAFCEYVADNRPGGGEPPDLEIDAEAAFTELTERTVSQIESLAPFGAGNARPVLCTTNVVVEGEVKPMGKQGQHFSVTLAQHGVRLRAVAFSRSDWADELSAHDGPLSVAFEPKINEFRGRRSVEMLLADWKAG